MFKGVIGFFAEKHIFANLLVLVVLLGGYFAWNNTNKEEYPDVVNDNFRIGVRYPGASAADVEYYVTKPIEEVLDGMEGVEKITSTSRVGSSSVNVELDSSVGDVDQVLTEIRNAVLDVRFPKEITRDPSFRVFRTSNKAIIDLGLYIEGVRILSPKERKVLQKYVLALESQLLALQEISSIDRRGYLSEEIQIKSDPKKLLLYDIPFNKAINEIRNNHIRQPAGSIEVEKEPQVTLLSELDTPEKLNELIIQGGFDGKVIKLKDVAEVKQGYEKNLAVLKVNGFEGVLLSAGKSSRFGILESLDKINDTVERFNKDILKGTDVKLILLDDESIDIRNRLAIISFNGILGFTFILSVLLIFLNFQSGLWVALGIPFSLCFTMILASLLGHSINGLTLAAVIIVMGMVVDDAIVVAENITRMQFKGMPLKDAIVRGTSFVILPIFTSIVTTCIAFVPLFFFDGFYGKMIEFIPPIIFLVLGASLLESLLILPGHMFLKNPFKRATKSIGVERGHWFYRVEAFYASILNRILAVKWLVVFAFIGVAVFAGKIAMNEMKFVMFPNEETRDVVLNSTVIGSKDRVETAMKTAKIDELLNPYLGGDVVGYRTEIGKNRRGGDQENHHFNMLIEIVPKDQRERSADDIIQELKGKLAGLDDFGKINIRKSRWGHNSSGSAVEIIVHQNDDLIRSEVLGLLRQAMEKNPEIESVEEDNAYLVPEYRAIIDREEMKRLSINPSSVASTMRAVLEGTLLYEFSDGDETIDVRFSINDESKNSIEKVLDLRVENGRGYLVPLREVVRMERIEVPQSIQRRDMRRTSNVDVDLVKDAVSSPVEIAEYLENEVFPLVLAKYPTTSFKFGGEVKDTRESKNDFMNAAMFSLFLIYVVLAVVLDSLSKPIIVMLAIPFGVVGVILTFWFHSKLLFGFFAAVGILGLIGVVINDSIIMLMKLDEDFKDNASGKERRRLIANSAKTRLRAVLLTTLTTVVGVLPTAYGVFGFDAMLSDMMLALAWGLVFGTFTTLVLVPCAYSIGKDLRFSPKAIVSVVMIGFLSSILSPQRVMALESGDSTNGVTAIKALSLDEYIELTTANDTGFESILIDEYLLQYKRDLEYPIDDLLLSIRSGYDFTLGQNKGDPDLSIGLNKLFPDTATRLGADYQNSTSSSSSRSNSSLRLTVAQNIAENAFGRSNKLLDQIIGVEIQVAKHQIVEAYEDYFATAILRYYDWYEAYQTLLIAQFSYDENVKLLDDVERRQKKSIALSIDKNKISLQVLAKKERLIEFEESYQVSENLIRESIRNQGEFRYVPDVPSLNKSFEADQGKSLEMIRSQSRTFSILRLLEKQSILEVDKDADDLLPSINLFVALEMRGEGRTFDDSENLVTAGLSFDFPASGQLENAKHETTKLLLKKQKLSNESTQQRVESNLKNIYTRLNRERKLRAIAKEKIALSRAILRDETDNYSYGKVSLNDYIDAVNGYDRNRFSQILHDSLYHKLLVEWFRLTDRLITKSVLK